MREPWFRIVEVVEANGRSIADIARDVADEHGVSLADIRGSRRTREILRARHQAMMQCRYQRPDLSSGQVAQYFQRDASTVRHLWAREAA